MNENELIEKWNDELFISKQQLLVGKRILEVIEREFDYDASALSDDEWNELSCVVVQETEGMTTDVDAWVCRVFAEMASEWESEQFYGIDPTSIEKWSPK